MIETVDSSISLEEEKIFPVTLLKSGYHRFTESSIEPEITPSASFIFKLHQIFLPASSSIYLRFSESFKERIGREEAIRDLVKNQIFIEPEAEKILLHMDKRNFSKTINFLEKISKNVNRPTILSVTEGDDEEELLLIVCFDKETFEEVDSIMDEIFLLIEDEKIAKITAVEKFQCQHLTGSNS